MSAVLDLPELDLLERDRRRIAADLHDGIGQRLVSAWYHLQAARERCLQPDLDGELAAAADLLDEALRDSRRVVAGLRPALLDELGLEAAIEAVAADLDGRSGLDVEVELTRCALPRRVESALFRIVQEALNNVVKHARANRVTVTLDGHAGGGVTLTVTDDGAGFEPARVCRPDAFGLSGLYERGSLIGASVHVRSAPGEGTTIAVTVPAMRC